jgi:hypothetical protein
MSDAEYFFYLALEFADTNPEYANILLEFALAAERLER